MKILPAIAIAIIVLLMITDIESAGIITGGVGVLAVALLVLEKIIWKKDS